MWELLGAAGERGSSYAFGFMFRGMCRREVHGPTFVNIIQDVRVRLNTKFNQNVKSRLQELGLSPRKALGQHFLIDREVLDRIILAAEIDPHDTILEIGPGLGMLTGELVRRAERVVAVELDENFARALQTSFAQYPNLDIVTADARRIEPRKLLNTSRPYKLIANLPYYAATPIVRRFLEMESKPTRMIITVQAEVARNMTAPPGRMGLLALSVQFYSSASIELYIKPEAFHPPPNVDSAVVRLDLLENPAIHVENVDQFFRLVRAAFSSPRKQLINSISNGLNLPRKEIQFLLEQSMIDPIRRASTLTFQEWQYLYKNWIETQIKS